MEIINEEKPKIEKVIRIFDSDKETCTLRFFDDRITIKLEEYGKTVKMEYDQIAKIALNYVKRPWVADKVMPTHKQEPQLQKVVMKLNEKEKAMKKAMSHNAEEKGYHTFYSLAAVLDVNDNTIRKFVKQNWKDYNLVKPSMVSGKNALVKIDLATAKRIMEDYNIYFGLVKENRSERMKLIRPRNKK